MTLPQIKNIIEAALMVSERPLTLERLMILFKPLEIDGPFYEQVKQALAELRQEYTGRGIELKEVASGFRFQARAELSPWLNQLWEERSPRYSRALLEILAIIAYRQPITRGEIEALRGVSVSSPIIRTLLEREWIRIAGHREVPGRPAVYVTTPQFLDHFNLKSLAELPLLSESLGELRSGDSAPAPDRAAPIAREAAG
jgi:segregation and condensation protein B